jgi:hypothetical protein
MNDLNIVSIFYITFRLAPFILVSFFSLSSILNQDLKGLIYLCGLLLACFVCMMIGNSMSSTFENGSTTADMYEETTRVCNLLTLSKSGPISNLPLSQAVFSYTFGYLMYIIIKYKLVNQNLPTLFIFPTLIASDLLWNSYNKCANPYSLFASMVIGGSIGVGWSAVIDSTKLTKLQYFNGLSNKESCSVPAKQSFKCIVKGTAPASSSQ